MNDTNVPEAVEQFADQYDIDILRDADVEDTQWVMTFDAHARMLITENDDGRLYFEEVVTPEDYDASYGLVATDTMEFHDGMLSFEFEYADEMDARGSVGAVQARHVDDEMVVEIGIVE